MDWTFGTVLWSTLVFFFWFVAIWAFIAVFADVFRRDMSGWAKAGWIALMFLLPVLGVLIYLIARPRTADVDVWLASKSETAYPVSYSASDEITKAGQLYGEGKITSQEYERLKRRALA